MSQFRSLNFGLISEANCAKHVSMLNFCRPESMFAFPRVNWMVFILLAGGLPLFSETAAMKDGSTREGRVVPPPPDVSPGPTVTPMQDIDRWEKFFLARMKELGFPENSELFRKEFESYCKDVGRMFTLERRKESIDREIRGKTWPLIKKKDVDYKNEEEKNAKAKVLEGNVWSLRAEVPATNEGITECWAKGKTGFSPSVSGHYTIAQLNSTIDKWFQYSWDTEQNKWVETTLARERACRLEAESEYRKKMEKDLAATKKIAAKDLSSNPLAREAYERVKTYLPKYEEALKKAEETDSEKEWQKRQAEGAWKSGLRFLFQTYQSSLKCQALEACLAELGRNSTGSETGSGK